MGAIFCIIKYMRNRRRIGFGSIFGLMIMLSIFGTFIGDFAGLFGVMIGGAIFTLAPFVIFFAIFKSIFALFKGNDNKYERKSRVSKQESVSTISNVQLLRIDRRLGEYFSSHLNLPIIDGVSLVPDSGSYQGVDRLVLTYNEERIISLSEFKKKQPDIYNKIMDMLVIFSKQRDDVIAADVKADKLEVKKEAVLSDAEKYIEKINELNRLIPQEEITNSLHLTCDLLKQIDLAEKKNNDKADAKVTKLYDYYLPILVSILERYKELSDAPIKGEEFKECETQLIKTILLINEALKSIYSSIHEDDYLNLSADMGTLQTLLAKDGYSDNPFGSK